MNKGHGRSTYLESNAVVVVVVVVASRSCLGKSQSIHHYAWIPAQRTRNKNNIQDDNIPFITINQSKRVKHIVLNKNYNTTVEPNSSHVYK